MIKYLPKMSGLCWSIGVFLATPVLYASLGWIKGEFPLVQSLSPDGKLYLSIAESIARGEGPVQSSRALHYVAPPLYPLYVSIFLSLGLGYKSAILFQYILFGLVGVFTFHLALLLVERPTFALISVGFMVLCNPVLEFGPRYLLQETLFTLFIIMFCFYGFKFFHQGFRQVEHSSRYMGLFLCAYFLSIFVRPHLLLLSGPLFLISIASLVKRQVRVWWVLTPWILFLVAVGFVQEVNQKYNSQKVAFTNYSGMALYIANNESAFNLPLQYYWSSLTDQFVGSPNAFYEKNLKLCELNMAECDQVFMNEVTSFWKANPTRSMWMIIRKYFYLFWGNYGRWDALMILMLIPGVFNAVHISNKHTDNHYLVAVIFLVVVVTVYGVTTSMGLITGDLRYRHPIIPVYIGFSVLGLKFFFDQVKRHFSTEPFMAGGRK